MTEKTYTQAVFEQIVDIANSRLRKAVEQNSELDGILNHVLGQVKARFSEAASVNGELRLGGIDLNTFDLDECNGNWGGKE